MIIIICYYIIIFFCIKIEFKQFKDVVNKNIEPNSEPERITTFSVDESIILNYSFMFKLFN